MIYDATQAIRILSTAEAAVFLNESRETVNRNARNHPVWSKYFFKVGVEYRTSPHLLMKAQEELAGITEHVRA